MNKLWYTYTLEYNRAGPDGALAGQAFPQILCFGSSLKCLDNSIWCTFPELFYKCKKTSPSQQMEDVNYLTTMITWPQASWRLMTDNVKPSGTTRLPPSANKRIMHKLITDSANPLPLSWPLKMVCWNHSGSLFDLTVHRKHEFGLIGTLRSQKIYKT